MGTILGNPLIFGSDGGGGGGNSESGTITGSGSLYLHIPVSKKYTHIAVFPPTIIGNSAGNVAYGTTVAVLGDTNAAIEIRQGSSQLSLFFPSAPTFTSSQIIVNSSHDFDTNSTYNWCAW